MLAVLNQRQAEHSLEHLRGSALGFRNLTNYILLLHRDLLGQDATGHPPDGAPARP
jgi:hypothetical protein